METANYSCDKIMKAHAAYPLLQAALLPWGILPIGDVLGQDWHVPLERRLTVERGVAHVLVDGVDGHLGDVLGGLGLDVERDQAVRHQVVDGLEALLPDKVLPIVVEAEVSGLVAEAGCEG